MKSIIRSTVFLSLFPLLLQGQIVTNPDSIEVYLNETILVDVLVNDYEIGADSIYVDYAPGYQVTANRYIVVSLGQTFQGRTGRVDTVTYHVKQVNGTYTNTGELYITLNNGSFDVLDVNNLSARFYAFGHHFWDFNANSQFFAPKNTLKSPIFNNTLWVAGMKTNGGTLHVAAELYRQAGVDYWAGPVSVQYDSLYDRQWNRMWKLTKAEINHHINNYLIFGYTPIPDIAEWPAHGDTTKGQLWQMAPFYDDNNNGVYEPLLGDYPLIRGDMAMFFVFNDARGLHTESGGLPLGIEVHGMAYGFDQPNDPMMYNTVFLHYDIINRSTYQYDDTYIGMFNDFDLGYAWDDYVQTDVKNGAVFAYNGTAIDGTGQPWAYGANPPAMGMQLLAGPYMNPDGVDNPMVDSLNNPLCDVSINGANFGDTIVDNERLGLSYSIRFDNAGPTYCADPSVASEYYGYLRGVWRDQNSLSYGGNGHSAGASYGPDCRFIFPAYSDSCLFGTGGLQPNGPFFWNEQTANNQPADRRMLGSSGPFTFLPGASHPMDVAFIFAWDPVANNPVDTLIEWFGKMKNLFNMNQTMFNPTLDVQVFNIPAKSNLRLFPNPASHFITIAGLESTGVYPFQLFGLEGRLVMAGMCSNGETIDISNLKTGLYFIRIASPDGALSRKFIKH
ncbi:MAG: T9SS type A sorting domain-containing protein [Bacteroidales bacterium]